MQNLALKNKIFQWKKLYNLNYKTLFFKTHHTKVFKILFSKFLSSVIFLETAFLKPFTEGIKLNILLKNKSDHRIYFALYKNILKSLCVV